MMAATDTFTFSPDNEAKLAKIIARYPEGRQQSAVIAALDIAQRQNNGWVNQAVIEAVAGRLGMAPIRVHEVASFYSMFNRKPVGRHFIQLCRTTPCWLRGSDDLRKACEEELGISLGETTPDGKFSLVEVECLGACVNAPMMQINDDYYEDLDGPRTKALLQALKRGDQPKSGPQTQRQFSAPVQGRKTLSGKTPASENS